MKIYEKCSVNQGHGLFITLAFIIRIIEALGNAAFLTASFAIIAKEFPDNVSVTFASLETFFGLGLIVGPMVSCTIFHFFLLVSHFSCYTIHFCFFLIKKFVLIVFRSAASFINWEVTFCHLLHLECCYFRRL